MLHHKFLSSNRIQNWRLFALVHYILDLLSLALAWYAAVHLRVTLNSWMSIQISADQILNLVPKPFLLLTLWTITAFWVGLYKRKRTWSAAHAIRQAFESDIVACSLAIALNFFSLGVSYQVSRSFVFLFGPFSFLLLGVSFYLAMFFTCTLQKYWLVQWRVAVLGETQDVTSFVSSIESSRNASLKVAGVILSESPGTGSNGDSRLHLPVLGTVRQLAEVINRERIDQLICLRSVNSHDFELCGNVSTRMGITFSRPLAKTFKNNVRYEFNSDYGLDLLNAEPVRSSHRQEFFKRVFDVAVSGGLLLLLSPLLITLAILIRSTSPGPVFFKSRRVGLGGRHFMFWKFRSMYLNGPRREDLLMHNERGGHIFKIRNDPRVTPLGRFIRRYSLDELPQLINVLTGHMSLVGPRPLPAEDMDPDGLSDAYRTWAEQRVNVRPGITGIWQIRGRSDLSFEQMVEYDLEYIRNWSLALDLQLLLETPLAVFSGRGAY